MPKRKPTAPHGTWSTGRPRGRSDYVQSPLVDRRAAEQTVIAALLTAGFVAAGQTEMRTIVQPNGVTVHVGGRKRFRRDPVRATVGLNTTYFYTMDAGDPEPLTIAVLKTVDVHAVEQTLLSLT